MELLQAIQSTLEFNVNNPNWENLTRDNVQYKQLDPGSQLMVR